MEPDSSGLLALAQLLETPRKREVEFDKHREILERFGTKFDPETAPMVRANQRIASRDRSKFVDKNGNVRAHWIAKSIRDRAVEVASARSELKALVDAYEWLYRPLSDFEHSAPHLVFKYLTFDDFTVRAARAEQIDNDLMKNAGRLLGLQLGVVVGYAVKEGLLSEREVRKTMARA